MNATPQPSAGAPGSSRPRRQWIAAAVVVLVLLIGGIAAAVITSRADESDGATLTAEQQRLRDSDPEGFAACDTLARGRTASDSDAKMASLFDAADHAKLSTTPAIKAAVMDVGSGAPAFATVELDAACADAGYPIPAAVAADE